MKASASPASNQETLPLRVRQRRELGTQIVHDSIHRREGWVRSYLLAMDGVTAGFGSVAVAGPWKGKPTVFEFYVLPPHRGRAFGLFEAFLSASGAAFFEVQTNDTLLTVMLHAYGRDLFTEKIVFEDGFTTDLPSYGAVLRPVTPRGEILECIDNRQGGGEWILEVQGEKAASGGVLFHYNRPHGDVYMEVAEPFRRRGLGAYLVQELKRECYELGEIPCARCNPANVASRGTLQKAGFVPYANIVCAAVAAR